MLIAIILYNEFTKDGIEFFSPGDFTAALIAQKGDITEHKHILHLREIKFTQETLFIKKGRVKLIFMTKIILTSSAGT
jgi:hypothetical protein